MSGNPRFRATSKRHDANNEAVVVHCSDHRFQEGFHEFISDGLGLHTYALLAIPGGAHFGAMEQLQPKFAKVGLQSLKFLVKRSGARRIVVIGHDDCLFFKEQLQHFFTESDFNQKQIANLKRARVVLREWFPRAAVELYLADADTDGSLQFVDIR